MNGITALWDCAKAFGGLCCIKANIAAKKNCPMTATVFKVLGAAYIISVPIAYAACIFSSLKSTDLLDTPPLCDSPNCDNLREYYQNLESQRNLICYSSNNHSNGTLFSPEEQADEAKRCEALKLWDICYPGIQMIIKKTAETFFFCHESGMLGIKASSDTSLVETYVTGDKGRCFTYYNPPMQFIAYNKDTCVAPDEVPMGTVRERCFFPNMTWDSY